MAEGAFGPSESVLITPGKVKKEQFRNIPTKASGMTPGTTNTQSVDGGKPAGLLFVFNVKNAAAPGFPENANSTGGPAAAASSSMKNPAGGTGKLESDPKPTMSKAWNMLVTKVDGDDLATRREVGGYTYLGMGGEGLELGPFRVGRCVKTPSALVSDTWSCA